MINTQYPENDFIAAYTELKKAKEQIAKESRLYAFISQVNQNIVREQNEASLFNNSCNIAIKFGKFRLAWIGIFNTQHKGISLIGQHGISITNLDEFFVKVKKINNAQKQILNGDSHYISNDFLKDLNFEDQKIILEQYNIKSCIVLPIKKSGKIIGSLNLYSEQINFFGGEEIKLMIEVAGDISFALSLFENNKKQKETDELLRMNEKLIRSLIEKSTDLKMLTAIKGNILYASPSIHKILGYSQEEFSPLLIFDIIHSADIAQYINKISAVLKVPEKSFFCQLRLKHKDGHWIWCQGTVVNLLDEPAVNALVSNFIDVSEIKIAEQIRIFEANNLNALINNTTDLMWSVDTNFKLITSNEPFTKIVRMMAGKTIEKGSDVLAIGFSKEQLKCYKGFYVRAFAGETFKEIEYVSSPIEFWSEISFNPIREGNQIIGTACHSRNITDIKSAERKLIENIDTLAEIAFMQSHQVREPIANILGLISLFKLESISDSPNKEIIIKLKTATLKFDNVIHKIVKKTFEIQNLDTVT